jgi:hypothetical protein
MVTLRIQIMGVHTGPSWRRPPFLLLYDAKAPNCQKNKVFNGLGHYAEWPEVADAVIKDGATQGNIPDYTRRSMRMR